jgi:hypothetical protein
MLTETAFGLGRGESLAMRLELINNVIGTQSIVV